MLIPLEWLDREVGLDITGIVHCGAHLGEEAEAYSKYTDTVLWIEGNPELIPQLRQNVAAYHHSVVCSLVGAEPGEVEFNVSNNGQSSSVLELGTHLDKHPDVHYIGARTLPMRTIDDIVIRNWALGSNFLALDLQGYELEALKGAERFLQGVRYVYTEINVDELYVGCARLPDLHDFLEERGFTCRALNMAGDTGWGDGFWMRESE
jgi:FkbM family methyltransferase